jgi:hypothetical protein
MGYSQKSLYFLDIFSYRTWQLGGPPFPYLIGKEFKSTYRARTSWLTLMVFFSLSKQLPRSDHESSQNGFLFRAVHIYCDKHLSFDVTRSQPTATWLNKPYLNAINLAYQLPIIYNSKFNLHSYRHKTFSLFRITRFRISQFLLGNPK